MDIKFKDKSLDKLEIDLTFDGGYSVAIVRSYRKKIAFIRSAMDERDLYAMRSLNFEKLKGSRSNQFSIRLNGQWRLILEFKSQDRGKLVLVISIEDYHK